MTKEEVKYCEFLNDQRYKRALKIPRYLSGAVHQLPKNEMKAIALWLELKGFFYDGRLKDFKKRRKCWALTLKMSFNALRYKVAQLERMHLVEYNAAGDLVLTSWDHFYNKMNLNGACSKKKRYYRLQNDYVNQVEYLFKYYAVKENFEVQQRTIEKKIYKKHFVEGEQMRLFHQYHNLQKNEAIAIEERQRRGAILINQMDSLQGKSLEIADSDPEFKRFRKKATFAHLYADAEKAYWNAFYSFNFEPSINFDISLTCQSMARLFGCVSASSGHYWQQLLGGVWTIEPRCVYIRDFEPAKYRGAVISNNLNGVYFEGQYKKGVFRDKTCLFRRLPNKIHLKELT